MAGVWIRRAPIKEPEDHSSSPTGGSAESQQLGATFEDHSPSPPRGPAGSQVGATFEDHSPTPNRGPARSDATFDCPVCYETFSESDEANVYTTICRHKICRGCLGKCLLSSMACPICRSVLLHERAQLGFPQGQDNMLGLFLLNPSFFGVPGSTILLRVFEPRYVYLIRQCIALETCFGLQAGFKARRGLLVSIRRHRELPDGHIVIEGIAVARYEAHDITCFPEEDPNAFGLYRMKSRIIVDQEESPDTRDGLMQLNNRADELLQAKFNDMSRYEKEVISKVCGARPLSTSTEFSFWLLGALFSPEPKANVLFSPSVMQRMQYCVQLLETDQPFECLMEEAQ